MHIENTDRLYDNADSFAMVFDNAWKKINDEKSNLNLTSSEKLKIVLTNLKDHPFWKSSPEDAKNLADFRIRLLNLN